MPKNIPSAAGTLIAKTPAINIMQILLFQEMEENQDKSFLIYL